MEMCYNGALVMPSSYAVMDEAWTKSWIPNATFNLNNYV